MKKRVFFTALVVFVLFLNFIITTVVAEQSNCTNLCPLLGSKRCSGNGYQVCGNYDPDSCLEWSNIAFCQSNELCSNGNCILNQTENPPQESCTSECIKNKRICSGNSYKLCEEIEPNCFKYVQKETCKQTEICSNGFCIFKTQNTTTQDKCEDGTLNSKCSVTKPLYCNNGLLTEKCISCGCPPKELCREDGKCLKKNHPPVIKNISKIILEKENNIDMDLLSYVSDEDNDEILITFLNNKKESSFGFLDCIIENNILSCAQSNKKEKKALINLEAKDQLSRRRFSIEIEKKSESFTKFPLAIAGKDIITYPRASFILDASKSYDLDNNLKDKINGYIWYEDENEIGRGISLKKSYEEIGKHKIKLKVIDTEELSSEDTIIINVIEKQKCKYTKTVYFPEDTICNGKWKSDEGETVDINSKDYSCNLFEVCDENIDYIIDDAISCCSQGKLDEEKTKSCEFANKYSQDNAKRCEALYVIKSLGGDQIYMQDYFEAEMCCAGIESICSNEENLYTSNPIPNTKSDLSKIQCKSTNLINPDGEWVSDTDMSKNNIALFDAPAHVSLNILKTGTCNDYSVALTTLLRKIGYNEKEVYTAVSKDHAYNLVKLPLDKKYTIVDTTGNNEPPIVLGNTPYDYPYCEGIKECYNEHGKLECPSLSRINGCKEIPKDENTVGKNLNKVFNGGEK